jgi:protein SCO1/2
MKKSLISLCLTASTLFAFAADIRPAQHSCCASSEAVSVPRARLSDSSLYQLDSAWTNDTGAVVKLASLKGRPQVVAMFFANCTYACPMLVYQMQQIEASLPETLRDKVGFTLISFDTERDIPAVLHNYRVGHALANERWTLLRGGPDDVLELAALLSVKFKKDAQGQFLHSNVITLLNAEGEILCQQTGLNGDQGEIIRRVSELARK